MLSVALKESSTTRNSRKLELPWLGGGSWPNAPEDHIIIGLKELPVETCELMMYKDAIDGS
jgi:hypothetical protein